MSDDVVDRRRMEEFDKVGQLLSEIAGRAAAALPSLRIAQSGTPRHVWMIRFDPTSPWAIEKAIQDLAAIVEGARPQRYFKMEMPQAVEHCVYGGDGIVRIVHCWDVDTRGMVYVMHVATA